MIKKNQNILIITKELLANSEQWPEVVKEFPNIDLIIINKKDYRALYDSEFSRFIHKTHYINPVAISIVDYLSEEDADYMTQSRKEQQRSHGRNKEKDLLTQLIGNRLYDKSEYTRAVKMGLFKLGSRVHLKRGKDYDDKPGSESS